MKTKYQIIILSSENVLVTLIIDTLFRHLTELGLNLDSIVIINEGNFLRDYAGNAPAFCLYFGDSTNQKNIDFLDILLKDATLILPIVNDLKEFSEQIPNSLENINAFELSKVPFLRKII